MWQVSIYFAGVWYGVGPEYHVEEEAYRAIHQWQISYNMQCGFTPEPFRIDKMPDRPLDVAGMVQDVQNKITPKALTVEEILAREG